jgi:hypothetical protein
MTKASASVADIASGTAHMMHQNSILKKGQWLSVISVMQD